MKKVYPLPYPRVKQLVDEKNDRSLVAYLIASDSEVTEQFLYGLSWPYFKHIRHYWYTTYTDEVDAANDVYLKIKTPKKKDGISPLEGFAFRCRFFIWFFYVAKRHCIDRWRKHRKLLFCPTEEMESITEDDSTVMEDNDTVKVLYNPEIVANIFSHMSNKRYIEVLRLRYFENLKPEEIAEAMNDSKDNIYRTTNRARNQFEEVLLQLYPEFYSEMNKKNHG